MSLVNNKIIARQPCPDCRALGKDSAGDNLVVYEDHSTCYACSVTKFFENKETASFEDNIPTILGNFNHADWISKDDSEFVGLYKGIPERGISEEVCHKLWCSTGEIYNKPAYGFTYGEAEKIRFKDEKKFIWVGDSSTSVLYGLHACTDYSKKIVITEGEFDALSLWEKGIQACSIFRGAGSAKKDVTTSLEELKKFAEIVVWFDNDEAGQKALKEVLEILPKSKTSWVYSKWIKDANEALLQGKLEEVLNDCLMLAKPVGILQADEIDFLAIQEEKIEYIPITFLPKVNEVTNGGFEFGTLNLIFAGVGSGKTTLLCHLGYHWFMNNKDLRIANLFYEENEKVTPLRYIAIHNNLPVGKLRKNPELLSPEQWRTSRQLFQQDNRMSFLGRECKRTSEGLFDALDYLVNRLHYNIILLDHISYIIGRSGVSKHGERRDIDELLYKLQDFSIKNNCIILAVSHITQKKEDKQWDEGAVPSVYSGRGSGALAQIPDVVIALARNTKNPYAESILKTYVVKNRWGGKVGETDQLVYNDDTGHFEVI